MKKSALSRLSLKLELSLPLFFILFYTSGCGPHEMERTPQNECQAMCNLMLCEDCLSPDEYGLCYGVCEMSSSDTQEQFLFCSKLYTECDRECYEVFTVKSCNDSCDKLLEADVSSTYKHKECFQECEQTTYSGREQFIHCVNNLGDRPYYGECINSFVSY